MTDPALCPHDVAVPLIDDDQAAPAVVCLCGARWISREQVPADVALRLDARLGPDAWPLTSKPGSSRLNQHRPDDQEGAPCQLSQPSPTAPGTTLTTS
ncbi:hypothetical protein GCM10020216_039170 [Nonomuraea helvata]